MNFIFCKLKNLKKFQFHFVANLMKRHAIGAGPSCLVNIQRFGSWAAWATHIASLTIFFKTQLKKSINYQCRTFGERRRTRKQPDDPYCELSMCTSWTHTDSIQSCMTIFVRKDAFFVTLFPFPAHHDSMIDGTLFFPWTSNYSWFGIKYQDILQTKIVNSPGDSRKWNWAHHDSRAHAAIVRSARQRYWTVPVWSWFLK